MEENSWTMTGQIPLGPIDTHYGGKGVETVEIVMPSALGGKAVINKADFDPAIHKLFGQEGNRYGEAKCSEDIWPEFPVGEGSAGAAAVSDSGADRPNGRVGSSDDAIGRSGSAGERSQRSRSGAGSRGRYADAAEAEGIA